MADVHNGRSWEGPVERGLWTYRVSLHAVTHQGRALGCGDEAPYDKGYLEVWLPPTPEEAIEFALDRCGDLRIVGLESFDDWDQVGLVWGTNAYELPFLGESHDHKYEIDFRVQRRGQYTGDWETVGTFERVPAFEHRISWEGTSQPGLSVYRVAVDAVTVGDETVWCLGDLHWREIVVETPSVEERMEAQAERDILIREANRCAKEALTANISDEALPTVNKYVEAFVSGGIPEFYGVEANEELAGWTLTVCATVGNPETSWAILGLLGF